MMHVRSYEYKEFWLDIEVIHHSLLINQLLTEGKIKPKINTNVIVSLCDSCYIARFNNIISEPRNVLKDLGMREMDRNRNNTFCWEQVEVVIGVKLRWRREGVQRVLDDWQNMDLRSILLFYYRDPG